MPFLTWSVSQFACAPGQPDQQCYMTVFWNYPVTACRLLDLQETVLQLLLQAHLHDLTLVATCAPVQYELYTSTVLHYVHGA